MIVEDGTGLTNSDSYISVVEADALAATYGDPSSTFTTLLTARKQELLKAATSILDIYLSFNGTLYSTTQALKFPRSLFYDTEGRLLTGVPNIIKIATLLQAEYQNENTIASSTEQGVNSVKVGPLEVSLKSDETTNPSKLPIAPHVVAMLSPYSTVGVSSRGRIVSRRLASA
jgi:hypothetical protein